MTTTYPGADSKTVADSVAAPIEAQINGVDNMLYMTSTSSNTGQMTLTVYFTLDTDPDIAQVQVQNRVNLAMPQLPEAVTQYGRLGAEEVLHHPDDHRHLSTRTAATAPTTSPTTPTSTSWMRSSGSPAPARRRSFGVPDQAMRIWMNPDRMASARDHHQRHPAGRRQARTPCSAPARSDSSRRQAPCS